jgi:mRNA interferase RelE/StbE
MIVRYSSHFVRSHSKAPRVVQEAFAKQSQLLLQNLHHPSLRAKKYDEAQDLWQARVNYTWRFYFRIVGDVYLMDEIKYHPK